MTFMRTHLCAAWVNTVNDWIINLVFLLTCQSFQVNVKC